MSTLKVNTISNNGTETDTPQGFTIAGNSIVQGYTESASEPSAEPNEGDIWWDTANSVVKRYVNGVWRTITTTAPSTSDFFGDRGVFLGDYSSNVGNAVNDIDYIDITTTGNAVDFGDFTNGSGRYCQTCSSGSRILSTVFESTATNTILYITPSTPSNTSDFGDMTVTGIRGAAGDGSRGLFAGGSGTTYSDVIDYVTIATTGNAVDFGDLSTGANPVGISNATYAVFGLSMTKPSGVFTPVNNIERVTVQTLGNSTDFGDLTVARYAFVTGCDTTRGCFAGGPTSTASYSITNVIDYITISTPGNAIDFGDLTSNGRVRHGGTSNSTRCVVGGGYNVNDSSSAYVFPVNDIEYWTTQTTGNSVNFGDLTTVRVYLGAGSGNAS